MNKIFSTALLAFVGIALTGCDDFLDENRYPETSIVNNPLYWSNPDNCQMQVNRMKQYFYGYGSGTGYGNFYFNTLSDDQCGNSFTDWKFTNVPSSTSSYSDPYVVIRGCNYIIEGVTGSSLSEAQKANFIAQARLIRGYEYYQLVRRYGDVILIEKVENPDADILYSARTDRKTVMDYAYEDMKYASENITLQSGKQQFSKDLAKAMLSELCLWEGTFWKYCTQADNYYAPDATRSKHYLELCVTYSEPLLASYPIGSNYAQLYNQPWSANAQQGFVGLAGNSEVIFATEYEKDVFMNSVTAYTCSSTAISGLTKDVFDAYLFRDGKPLASTTLNKTDVGVKENHVEGAANNGPGLSIQNLLDVRDARLAATTDPYIYYKGLTWIRWGANPMTSASGYGVRKYDNPNIPDVLDRTDTGKNYLCSPLYWGAVIALNYAEAKAELNTLTDADLNKTLNKLYARAELPNQTVASLSAIADPANNMRVSSLIWEVRRCRRCELIMDNDYRYWDLVRWHQLNLLDSNDYPNILLGANATNAPVAPESVTGVYVNSSFGRNRIYDNRQYQWPIPSGQITLNPKLEQQPNWK